jgi:hypothetical protein
VHLVARYDHRASRPAREGGHLGTAAHRLQGGVEVADLIQGADLEPYTANPVFGAWVRLPIGSTDPALVTTLQSAPSQDPEGQIAAGKAFGTWFAATVSTVSTLAIIASGGGSGLSEGA